MTASEDETAALAARFASALLPGDIVCLRGGLGAGKSVFARAAIRSLRGDPGLDVPSPTFTLVQVYKTPLAPLWHFDLYRLKNAEEIYELGWEECRAQGIALVEWPERMQPLLPPNRTEILIEGNGDRRVITISVMQS